MNASLECSAVDQRGTVDNGTTVAALLGGIGSFLLAVLTAFFALRRTVVEATAAENQAFFVGLGKRLGEVEDDLAAERIAAQTLRLEVIDLREQLSTSRTLAAELERRNVLLEEERDVLRVERTNLQTEISRLEERLDFLETHSIDFSETT